MPNDYKHMITNSQKTSFWKVKEISKWFLIIFLVGGVDIIWTSYFSSAIPPLITDCAKIPASILQQSEKGNVLDNKIQFEFYRLLSGEVDHTVQDDELKTQSRSERNGDQKNTFVLQLGWFPNIKAAEAFKAQMNTYPVKTRIEKITGNSTIWYRVSTAPIINASAAYDLRVKLKSNGIDSLVIKN